MTREEAIEVLEIILEEYRDGEVFAPRLPALEEAIKILKQPERKKGKWIVKTEGPFGYCSRCGYGTGFYPFYDFCPHCGAKMDKEEEK